MTNHLHIRDVIVCLGQALLADANPNPILLTRCDKAVELHQIMKCPIINTGGDPVGVGRTEARVMSEYMKSVYRVEQTFIIEEGAAQSTVENAVFVLNLLKDFRKEHEGAFSDCIINVFLVTSPHHMPRSSYIFKAVFGHDNFKFKLIESPSIDSLTSNMLKQNLMYEKNGIVSVRNRRLISKYPVMGARAGHNIPLPEDSVLLAAITKIDILLEGFE